MTAATRRARAAKALVDREGGLASYNGSSVQLLIRPLIETWLASSIPDVREMRWEVLLPESSLASAPAAGDQVIDGTDIYDVTTDGVLEHGLWRAPIRPRD